MGIIHTFFIYKHQTFNIWFPMQNFPSKSTENKIAVQQNWITVYRVKTSGRIFNIYNPIYIHGTAFGVCCMLFAVKIPLKITKQIINKSKMFLLRPNEPYSLHSACNIKSRNVRLMAFVWRILMCKGNIMFCFICIVVWTYPHLLLIKLNTCHAVITKHSIYKKLLHIRCGHCWPVEFESMTIVSDSFCIVYQLISCFCQ